MADETPTYEQIDYSQILADIDGDIVALESKVDTLSGEAGVAVDNSAVVDAVEKGFGSLNGKVDSLAAAVESGSSADVGSDGEIAELQQLVALADVLLIVLVLFLAVNAGLTFGGQVTRWLRERG